MENKEQIEREIEQVLIDEELFSKDKNIRNQIFEEIKNGSNGRRYQENINKFINREDFIKINLIENCIYIDSSFVSTLKLSINENTEENRNLIRRKLLFSIINKIINNFNHLFNGQTKIIVLAGITPENGKNLYKIEFSFTDTDENLNIFQQQMLFIKEANLIWNEV